MPVFGDVKVPRIGRMFLDSGAHSIYNKHCLQEDGSRDFSFYKTDEFWEYVDSYARFVKKYRYAIDVFANVDVIRNPKMTWRVQQYMEKQHGLRPLPVVHAHTDLKWLDRYIRRGYEYVGIGGLGQDVERKHYNRWLDRLFTKICPVSNKYKPAIKTHGFAITSHHFLTTYPWYSVDSTTYAKMAGYGWLLVPPKKNGEFDFRRNYLQIGVSPTISPAMRKGKHIGVKRGRGANERAVMAWLDHIELPLGEAKQDPVTGEIEVVEEGVVSDSKLRQKANLLYFKGLADSLPAWPWRYQPKGTFF